MAEFSGTRDVRWGERAESNSETVLAVAVLGILLVILVPLPTFLMDALLIANFTGSVVFLMTTLCVKRPIEFSVFPSLLLVVTFFRLALNVATTRLILSNAQRDELLAAGQVVRAFADFVAGSNLVVGLILFCILVLVQFLVITRGTTRISEVAARFALDAMPGKQLSIDGELSAGLISDTEARKRRAELTQEANFFGAMDGASKFVRGEAIAAMVIMLTNLLGGFVLGTMYHSMSLGRAAETYAKLTIGDGLVTQVPALVISVAAALLITKNSGSEGFGQDILRQLLRNERVFYVAAVFLLVLLPSGLPKAGLILGATVCAIVGLTLARNAGVTPEAEVQEPEVAPAKPRPSEEAPGDAVRSLLAMEPIELEIGYRLVGLVDEARGGDLMGRLAAVRERIALDIGLVVPPVKVRDNTLLHPGEYNVKLRGNSIGCWRVYPGMTFVVTEGEQLEALDGIPGTDPATGLPGLWAKESDALIAARSGFSTRNIPEIVTEHLGNLIRVHAGEILTRVEVSRLVGDLRGRAPALVDELIPGVLKIGDVHRVLQSLLREQVSIRNLELILETLADNVAHLGDPAQMTECVRRALARTIGSPLAARDGVIHAALLDPALEEFLQSSLERGDNGSALNIGPEVADTLVDSIAKVLMELERLRFPSVLVCSSKIRAHIRNLMARRCPQAAVLSYEEVKDDFRLEVHGNVALEAVH